jgi:hypothetical protein
VGRLCPIRTEKARTYCGTRTKGSREQLHTALQVAREQVAVVVAWIARADRSRAVVAWAGRSKRVDIPLSTLVEVQLAGMAHSGEQYMVNGLAWRLYSSWG